MTLIEISKEATKRSFTHLLCVNERLKNPWSITFSVLKTGPTLMFRVRKFVPSYEIFNRGNPSGNKPELNFKNFNTALGRRVARGLSSLFDNDPDMKARTLITFHNQRDFIFFRHHRYIFKEREKEFVRSEDDKIKVNLQEIGPRFTLQLKKFYSGCFNEQYGEYEFLYRGDYYVQRNRFYL